MANSQRRDVRSRSAARGSIGLNAGRLAPLVAGIGALLIGTAIGWDPSFVQTLVHPPPLIRAALVGTAVVLGIAMMAASVQRLGGGSPSSSTRDLPAMIRGIRMSFLAVAAFAAAAGWVLAHPLPIVVALIVAGVDIIETSFLLLVVTVRRR
jgi:hypothetical protein